MVIQLANFKGNAIALELVDTFTEADADLIKQLFEEKLNEGYKHVNILVKVKDMSIMKHMDMKGFLEGEFWGIKHFGKIGKCAVVAHSETIKTAVNIESKVLRVFNHALEEKYFDTEQLDEALAFIAPEE